MYWRGKKPSPAYESIVLLRRRMLMVSERPMVLFRGGKRMHTDRGPLGPVFFRSKRKLKALST